MKKRIILICFVFLFFSCQHKEKSVLKFKKVNIGDISLEIPESYNYVKSEGIDSYVAYIINEEKDTFNIEYGKPETIFKLFIEPPMGFPLSSKENFMKRDGKLPSEDEVIFTNSNIIDNRQNIFDKNFYKYDTINEIILKIVQPKKIGNGMTGLYIPLLKDGSSFSIYANNLDSVSHLSALNIFKTIKYK